MAVDLHLHSTVSDGTLEPAEIIAKASKLKLTAVSLTDHDSFGGVPEAMEAAQRYAVDFIPGVELSTNYQGQDVHILGYFADHLNGPLNDRLRKLRESRVKRSREIVTKLREIGLDIDVSSVEKLAKGEAVGRPHIAQALVNSGQVKDINEAFEKYLGHGRPGHLTKYVLEIDEIFKLVHGAGGVTSLAHPSHWDVDESVLVDLKKMGLDAVEVWHIDHTQADVRRFGSLAAKVNLLVSGGSDCHGERKKFGPVMGSLDIPDGIIEPLRQRALDIRQFGAKISDSGSWG